ncbi:transporter [Caerostris extrusa]|uniref:Transporter n=1 Tax=Caerostris extrusa TaxID=172846 RepID=A0AAV4R890_CAEEX|nr:transporter [Caerostris extrusa]
MGGLESVITGILDECSTYFTKVKMNREIFLRHGHCSCDIFLRIPRQRYKDLFFKTQELEFIFFSQTFLFYTRQKPIPFQFLLGGGYMMYWFDTYSAGISLLCAALFEAIGVAWIYGCYCIRDYQQFYTSISRLCLPSWAVGLGWGLLLFLL